MPLPLFFEFYAGATCLPYSSVLDGRGAKLREEEISSGLMQILSLSFIFPYSSSSFMIFLLAFFYFPFPDCKQPSTFVWIYL